MAADFAGIALGFLLFSAIALAPGYVLGYCSKLFDFRERSASGRAAIAIALSISVSPLLSFLLGNMVNFHVLLAIYGFCACGTAALLFKRPPTREAKTHTSWVLPAIAVGWLLLGAFSLVDWQLGHRLYFSVTSYDTCIRAAMTGAIANFGLPAQTPFFFPSHPALLRYHYLWLIQAALVQRFSGGLLSGRQAFISGGLWCGLGLLSTLALYLRFFSPLGARDLRLRIFRAWLLLGVTGLDILPALLWLILARKHLISLLPPSVEWWNEQVDGWVYTMLWEPHYISAVVACFTGFLLIWMAAEKKRQADRWVSSLVSGWAFASAVGLSIYVTFVFAGFLLVWTAITLWRRWLSEFWMMLAAGLIALGLSIPFLRGLTGPGSGGQLLQFTVRRFFIGDGILIGLGVISQQALALSNLLLLPLNYFLELGFFFAVGALMLKVCWRKSQVARHELALLTMTGISVAICTFVRSALIDHNDLGWRGFLVAQFALLIAAVELWSTGILRRSRFLSLLLVLGAAGTAYDVFLLRFFPSLADGGLVPKIAWLSRDANLGSRTYANREAYEWLKAHSDRSAVIQQDPHPELQDVFYGLYADRRTASADSGCLTTFGGDPGECQALMTKLTPLFSEATTGLQALQQACASLPIDFFVAKDTDPEWRNPTSWVWQQAPVFTNDYVRVFSCGKG